MAALPPGLRKNKRVRIDPNLQKLSLRFQKAQQAYASESAKSLSDYQSKLDEYNAQFTDYEARAKAFQDRVDAYQAQVDEASKPNTRYLSQYSIKPTAGAGSENVYYVELAPGQRQQPYISQVQQQIQGAGLDLAPGGWGTQFYLPSEYKYESGKVFGPGEVPAPFTEVFEEKPPETPGAPDFSAAQAKLASEEQYYKREVGERQLGRIRARRRVAERPLLGGTTA